MDLVIDRVPQIDAEKPRFSGIVVDSLREIAANKLCVDRFEPRDLGDLRLLLETRQLADVVRDAQLKHLSADPATLAFAVETQRFAETAAIPPGETAEALDAFRTELVRDLAKLALPPEP